ncbi:MAG: PAS domain S-box protein [Chitinophagaceae bacterium]|nr:PAS domain S-box protein [Chitinophagaceae bacterium]
MGEKSKNAEEKFEAVFQNASLGILVVDQKGEIILANNFLLKLFGYETSQDLIGKKMEVLIPARMRDQHSKERKAFAEHPSTRPMGMGRDLFGITKDGREIPLEISLSSYSDNEGTYSIAFLSDITSRISFEEKLKEKRLELAEINKKMEQLNEDLEDKVKSRTLELQEALDKLESSRNELAKALSKERDLGEMKSAFVSMASHEFRTPLSTILSSASLLAKYKLSEEQEKRDKHIQRIKSSVINLNNILNEFLSLGKIEEGKIKANFTEFDIKELIYNQYQEMSEIFKAGQKVDYVHTGKREVRLDQNLFKNILINLLSNAAKFSPDNATIFIRTNVTDGEVGFSIRDEGMGISEKDQEQLFTIFFRGQNANNIPGTGLGLHIVSKYAEMLNGKLKLTSQLGTGTEIKITFAQ